VDATHKPVLPTQEVKKTNYIGIYIGKNPCVACVADEQ
jgi:hypothetical protein